jgi:hypothetical protein
MGYRQPIEPQGVVLIAAGWYSSKRIKGDTAAGIESVKGNATLDEGLKNGLSSAFRRGRVNRILGLEEDLGDILAKSLRQAKRQREQ